ncbi:hypothetical protein ABPG72_007214 [Tetrahymena utriculariae]
MVNEAEVCYLNAILIYPQDCYTHYNLGLVYEVKCMFDKALDCYKKTLEISPKYLNAYQVTFTLIQRSMMMQLSAIKKILELDPNYIMQQTIQAQFMKKKRCLMNLLSAFKKLYKQSLYTSKLSTTQALFMQSNTVEFRQFVPRISDISDERV